jgi:hypothetical protein
MIARGEAGFGDDGDRLPWLETVEEDYREGPSIARIALLVLLALAVIAAASYGYWWFTQQRGSAGNGALIEAPAGDYKVRPDEPGGMKVEGEGDTVFSTSQGAASNASINVGALPEAPVEGKAAPKAGETPGTAKAKVEVPSAAAAPKAAPAPARAAPLATGSGSVIQLGAFPSEGGANTAWARFSKRFSYLAPLGKSVERAEVNGKGIWRLRVNAGSNGQARDLCGRLKVAGEPCFVAN